MAFRDMLDKTCRILRLAPQALDNLGTPIPQRLDPFGTPIPGTNQGGGETTAAKPECIAEGVPCALSRRVLATSQEDGRSVLTDAPRLYMLAHEDLREGDLVDIDGVGRFRCGRPYRPRNHHIECDVESMSEV